MGFNKFTKKDGTILCDLTTDTITAEKLAKGYTAHDRSGNVIVGTYEPEVSVEETDVVQVIDVFELPNENIDTTSVYRVNKITDILLNTSSSEVSLMYMFTQEDFNITIHTAPTKPTENIQAVDMENKIAPVYFIEDENEIFLYADVTGSGSFMWLTLGQLLFEGMYSYIGAVNDYGQTTDVGYYIYIGDQSYHHRINIGSGNERWVDYNLTDDYKTINSNGVYDVTNMYEVDVRVPTIYVVKTVADLPLADSFGRLNAGIAIVLEGGN